MSPFLDNMYLYESPAILADWVAKLEGSLEEEKKGSREVDLVLEAPSSNALWLRWILMNKLLLILKI